MSADTGLQSQPVDKLTLGRQMVRKFAGDKHVDAVAASMVSLTLWTPFLFVLIPKASLLTHRHPFAEKRLFLRCE